VDVAHQFIVVVDTDVLTQHPSGEHLHEFGGLIAIETGDQSGCDGLAKMGDQFAIIGLLADFKFVKGEAELATEALGSALDGACVIFEGGCSLCTGGALGFRDVDDQLAFVVSYIGSTFGYLGLCVAAVFSSSGVNHGFMFIV